MDEKPSTHHLVSLICILQSGVWEQASTSLNETRLDDDTTLPYVVRGSVVKQLQMCERLRCHIPRTHIIGSLNFLKSFVGLNISGCLNHLLLNDVRYDTSIELAGNDVE